MKTTTAKENLLKLPEWCFGVLLVDNSLITIKAGEMGYYKPNVTPDRIISTEGKSVDEIADALNEEYGVTKAQRKAMEYGSQFGWEVGFANPEVWEKKFAETAN